MISLSYLARGSVVKVAVAGPNRNPVVFMGVFVDTLRDRGAEQHGLSGGASLERTGSNFGRPHHRIWLR